MTRIANPIYDATYKYLIQDNDIASILIGNMLSMKLLVKNDARMDNSYLNRNNGHVYYSRFDAVFLEGKYQLEKLYIELWRCVNEDSRVSFMMQFIGMGGEYRLFIDPKRREGADKDIDKLLYVFNEGVKHADQKFVEIDESFGDFDDYRTLVTFLQKACDDSELLKRLDEEQEQWKEWSERAKLHKKKLAVARALYEDGDMSVEEIASVLKLDTEELEEFIENAKSQSN